MYYFKNINSKCTFPFWNVCHFTYPIIQNHFTVFYWGCPFLFWCPCCQKLYSLSLNRRKSQKLTLLWKSAFETDNLRMAGNSPVQQWLAVFFFYRLTYWFDVVCWVSWFFGVCFAFVLELLDTSFFFLIAGWPGIQLVLKTCVGQAYGQK